MSFYGIFESLCREKGVTPTQAARENDIAQSVVAMWKKRGSTPNAITLVQLAEYFHTTPAYLAGNPLAKNPYDLEQRDQAMRDHVARRFKEATTWKASKDRDRLIAAFNSLNPSGQDEAVKRVEELTEISRYRAESTPQQPTVAHQPPPRDETPGRGTDNPPSPEGAEGPGE